MPELFPEEDKFRAVLLKVWSLGQKDQHPLELIRNAESRASPHTAGLSNLVLTNPPIDFGAH